MAGNYGRNQYKQVKVTTASRGQVLILLYEGAIRFLKKAHECMEKKDLAGKGVAIGKAHDIINELNNALDFKVGGQISIQLELLYNFMISELMLANLHNSLEKLESVQKLLETLLEGWKVAVKEFDAMPPAQQQEIPKDGQ